MKKLIAILILTITTLNAWGAKAYPFPLTITQKDGKQLTYQLHGDEHCVYFTTTDGILLCKQGNDFYIAIINDSGELSSSGVLAHNAGQRTAEEIALIGKQDKNKYFVAQEKTELRKGMKRITMPSGSSTLFPHIGTPKALVILADFTDQSFKHDDQTTMEIFDQYLNASGTPTHESDATLSRNVGSVAKYFKDMSNELFVPQFEIATVVHLNNPMETYGFDEKDKDGNITDIDPNFNSFIKDVCTLADEVVDFSQYDDNKDLNVDLVYIIYAGYGESTGGEDYTIWPKSGTVSLTNDDETSIYYDGMRICRYGVNPELNFSPSTTSYAFNDVPQINGIGLFCHEFSHCMGLPDLYPIGAAQDAGNPAMEFWDVMDGGEYSGLVAVTVEGRRLTAMGGYSPTAYTAWEREFMGWMEEMDVLKNDMGGELIELVNIDKNGGKAYKIFPNDDETGNEYVFIQNIQPYKWNGSLGQYLGHGMLVTYVCYDKNAFTLGHYPNNTIGKSRMTIVPADGLLISSYLADGDETDPYTRSQYLASHKGDPFPGSTGVQNLFSIPLLWKGKPMEKPLVNIKERSNGVVTFNYLFEPEEKIEDESEENVYALEGIVSTATDPDIEQVIKTYDHNQTPSYQVFNFQGVAFNFDPYDATSCNVLTICVKPLQNTTLNVTLSSDASSSSSAKVMMDSGKSVTSLSDNSHTVTYELEANKWKTLSIQLHGFSINGVDMSQVTNLTISNGNEEYEGNTIFLEDVYFCETTKRGIATAIRQTDFDSTTKETKIYTLDGRYVGNSTRGLAKGVYIINGKKTVIR